MLAKSALRKRSKPSRVWLASQPIKKLTGPSHVVPKLKTVPEQRKRKHKVVSNKKAAMIQEIVIEKIFLVRKKRKKNVIPLRKRRKNRLFLGEKHVVLKKRAKKKQGLKKKARQKLQSRRYRAVSGDAGLIPVVRVPSRRTRRLAAVAPNPPMPVPPVPVAVPVPPPHIAETHENRPQEATNLVPGDLYNPIFSFDIPTPQVQVEPQVWDSVRENLPNNYLIPDPAFINVLSRGVEAAAPAEIYPELNNVETDESVGPLLDANLISALSHQVTPEVPPGSSKE